MHAAHDIGSMQIPITAKGSTQSVMDRQALRGVSLHLLTVPEPLSVGSINEVQDAMPV